MQRKFIALITVLLAIGAAYTGAHTGAHTGAQPNILLLLADDAGFADFGFMDEVTGIISPVPTPNLDSLRARAGIDGVIITRQDLGDKDIINVTLPLPEPPLRQIFTRLSLSGL